MARVPPPLAAAGSVTAILLGAVLVLGYVVLWAIWHFWFRGADVPSEHRRRPPGDES